MKIRSFFIIGLALAAQLAVASSRIYFYSGRVEVIEKNKQTHQVLAVNEVLGDDAILKLSENAEVILKDASGQFAVIHKAGEYNSLQIAEQFKAQQGKGLVTSLANFLGAEATNKKDDMRKMAENYMKQKGGVTRSGNVYPLMILPAYGSVSETNEVRFTWTAMPKVSKYEFVLFGGTDANNLSQLSKTSVVDTFMDVTFSDFGVTEDAYFSWVVYPEGDPNYSRYSFKIATATNVRDMVAEVEKAAKAEPNKEDALLIKALAFEKKGLVNYAESAYKDLLTLNNKTAYRELYTLFQIRNGLLH